jgi:hypothetical protein
MTTTKYVQTRYYPSTNVEKVMLAAWYMYEEMLQAGFSPPLHFTTRQIVDHIYENKNIGQIMSLATVRQTLQAWPTFFRRVDKWVYESQHDATIEALSDKTYEPVLELVPDTAELIKEKFERLMSQYCSLKEGTEQFEAELAEVKELIDKSGELCQPGQKPDERIDFTDLMDKELDFYGVCHNEFRVGYNFKQYTFEVLEDQYDGWRSMLGAVLTVTSSGIFFNRPIAKVRLVDDDDDDFQGYALVDVKTGHKWLEFGTSHYCDYYPCFTFDYNPDPTLKVSNQG